MSASLSAKPRVRVVVRRVGRYVVGDENFEFKYAGSDNLLLLWPMSEREFFVRFLAADESDAEVERPPVPVPGTTFEEAFVALGNLIAVAKASTEEIRTELRHAGATAGVAFEMKTTEPRPQEAQKRR